MISNQLNIPQITKNQQIFLNQMKGRLISHIKSKGSLQMELDKFLLTQSFKESNFVIIARFYSWKGNWVSIGKNQTKIPKKWDDLVTQKKIEIIRRPTGGDAVLHSGGITYSLIWKQAPKGRKEAYKQASQWIVDAFSDLGITLRFGTQKTTRTSANCFSTATAADLIDKDGFKRVGSAQLWKKGHILQHGEILVNPPKDLWMELFESNPPKAIPVKLSIPEIESFLSKSLTSYWENLQWEKASLDKTFLNELVEKKTITSNQFY